jgi:peptide/nickel transport system substrate-binding protein
MTRWNIDRRAFLRATGALGAGLAMQPRFAWSADGDTLRIRMDGDLQTLDPAFMIGGIEDVIMRGIYVSLNRLGDLREGSPWAPWGAEKLEQTDPKSIAFTLIDGLKWSNGLGPVTADDVRFSYERIADPNLASPWAYQFEQLDRVEAIDARNGIIHLKSPYQPIFVTSLPYYGGHVISRAGTEKAGGKFTTEPPATCGPYLFTEWQQKQKVTLTANPDWPGQKPEFGKVEIYIVADDQAAQLAYEADAFDYTKIAISATKAVKASPPANTAIIEAQSTRYVWLTINMLSPRLQDPKVRQAVQYGVDVSQILTGVYDDLTQRSTGVVQPGTKFARAKNLIEAADYEKANALLAEARVSDLSLTLTVMNDSIRTATAQIIQASLEQAGIKVEIQPYDEAAFWGVGDKTQGEGYKNIDLALMDFAGGVDPSENLVWFRPGQIGAYNWSGFDSAEFETSYQQLVAEMDPAKRIALSNRMEDLMEQSGGFVFICHQPLVVIHKANFEPVIYPDGHPNPVLFKKKA